ncbi:hypothetical protein LG307_02670 [Sutcliffiella horikoshii]|uniref:hypothetical protein n=1 Tax=Sutcliffiella horikoshii TaxID=79883 RepID=UPI00384B2A4B
MSTREDVIRIIKELPETATTEDIMRKLYDRLKIEKGINELDRENSVSHQQVKETMSKWLK